MAVPGDTGSDRMTLLPVAEGSNGCYPRKTKGRYFGDLGSTWVAKTLALGDSGAFTDIHVNAVNKLIQNDFYRESCSGMFHDMFTTLKAHNLKVVGSNPAPATTLICSAFF
jgi:hypothetical protein